MERLNDIREQSKEGTLEAVICGGSYFTPSENSLRHNGHYIDSINFISSRIQSVLGVEPIILTGPKRDTYFDDVYYYNSNRKVYIIRPRENDSRNDSYYAKNINIEKEKWR